MPNPKKAQRTKGNVKPSSSSQAALLLAAAGQTQTGFMGFSNLPAFVPASESFDDADSILDPDCRLVLRKLSKRDSVTKVKALQEFISLCNSKDEECIKAMVPFWPRVYTKVAVDVDHKVRELNQKALGTLAAKAGKSLAPHLKSIMGSWMLSMCDTYPTVASAANAAFINTFSGPKQTEAVRFCKAETAECLVNYILQPSPQALSDGASTASEESMQSKYERVVSSSLLAFSKLLHMLPADSIDDAIVTYLNKLMDSSVFWKHAKSTVPQVQCGVLKLLSTTCQLCPESSKKAISKVAPFIFSSLNSSDPNVVSHSWEAVLSLISTHEECWQYVNWQKAVWPKLKQVLENGCSGQATIICPCLLPLLSKIPNVNLTHFFDSFRLGLKEVSISNSPLELSALVRSFLECIQFGVKHVSESGGNSSSEIRSMVLDQVLTIVQTSLTDLKAGLAKTELYDRMRPVLSSVAKIDGSIETAFWSELSLFVREILVAEFSSADGNNLETSEKHFCEPVIFQRLKLLFEGITFNQTITVAKTGKVKFVSNEGQSPHRKFNFGKEKQTISEPTSNFMSDIFVTVFKLISINKRLAPLFFVLFKDLSLIHIPKEAAERLTSKNDKIAELTMLDLGVQSDKDYYSCIGDDFRRRSFSTSECDSMNCFTNFVGDHLVKLLWHTQLKKEEKSSENVQFTDNIILSLFAFVAYVDEDAGSSTLFEIFNSLTEPRIICQFIDHLQDFVKVLPACRPLLAGTQMAEKIEKLTMSVSTDVEAGGESKDVWRVLTSFVSSFDESDNSISQSCLDAILSSCMSALQQVKFCDETPADENLVLVLDLVKTLLNTHQVSMQIKLRELVLTLLPLLMTAQIKKAEVLWQLESCWLHGLRTILCKKSDVEIQLFVSQCCTLIKNWIQSNVNTLESLAGIGKVIKSFLQTIASPTLEASTSDDQTEEELESFQGTGDAEEVDHVTLAAAYDQLLIVDCTELDCLMEVYEYLYIAGSLDSLPQSFIPNKTDQLSPQTFLVKLVHNLSSLLLRLEFLPAKFADYQEKGHHWSEAQILMMAELCHNLVLLETAFKIKGLEFPEWSSELLIDLQTKLIKCIKTLNADQLIVFTSQVKQRSDGIYPTFKFGIESILKLMCRLKLPEEITSPSISSALLSVRMSFLSRCVQSEDVVKDVSELLVKSDHTAHNIYEAFTLASTVILSCEDINLHQLSYCISGLIHLAKNYNALNDEVKLSMFNQITDIVKQLKEHKINLLNGREANVTTVDHFYFNISIIQALKALVMPGNDQYWEFTLCSVVEWIQFLSQVKLSQTSDVAIKALFVSACDLAYLAAQTFNSAPVTKEILPDGLSTFVTEKAKTEWTEFFSEVIFSPLLPMFVSLASLSPNADKPTWTMVILPLSSAVSLCPRHLVLSHQIPHRLTATDKSSLPDNLKTLFNHLCPLLMARQRCVEVASFNILSRVIEDIPKHEASSPDDDGKQEEELRSPPEALVQHMEAAGHFLDCLKEVHLEEHIEMDIGTDEHSQAMGYLLAWRLLLQLFECSPNQLRAKYAQYFKANDSVNHLLDLLFRLIPTHPSPTMLEFSSELHIQGHESETELSSQALYVYRSCLDIVPTLVRAWWVDQDRKSSNFVDKFTTQYLSSGLIHQQITSAQNTNNIEDISIRALPAAREVCATCEMAEVKVNMTITLPENYPLGKLEVTCDKRVGVSQSQWDRWLLQLNIFLQHQNGSIVEGLRLWKGNIDKKFEGIEDCMVCFCVIHGTTFQLPRLTCKTCRKKFHSACLYKWFTTAQKSTCPLCRNVF